MRRSFDQRPSEGKAGDEQRSKEPLRQTTPAGNPPPAQPAAAAAAAEGRPCAEPAAPRCAAAVAAPFSPPSGRGPPTLEEDAARLRGVNKRFKVALPGGEWAETGPSPRRSAPA